MTAGLSLGADPPLTSVDMSLEGVGRKAAELLLAAIHGGAGVRPDHRASRLITRASSGPHAAPAKSPAGAG